MSNAISLYNNLAEEVLENHSKILNEMCTNINIANLYKGTQILFSPLIEKPTILLMGINPGPGYFNQTDGERVAQFKPLNELEYIVKKSDSVRFDYVYNYVLAVDTRKAFQEANLTYLLESQTVKSNVYYTATKDTTDLWKLVCALCGTNLNDPETVALDWTRRLVDIISPKVIICEGAIAYQELTKAITGRKMYFRGKKVTKQLINGYTIIGYCRKRNSGISDLNELVKVLIETFK